MLLQHIKKKTTGRVTQQPEAEHSCTWCSQGLCDELLQMFSKHPGQISRFVAFPVPESHSTAQLSLLKHCFPPKPQYLTSFHPHGQTGSLESHTGFAQPGQRSPAPRARASASAVGRKSRGTVDPPLPVHCLLCAPALKSEPLEQGLSHQLVLSVVLVRELQLALRPHPVQALLEPEVTQSREIQLSEPWIPHTGFSPNPNYKLVYGHSCLRRPRLERPSLFFLNLPTSAVLFSSLDTYCSPICFMVSHIKDFCPPCFVLMRADKM